MCRFDSIYSFSFSLSQNTSDFEIESVFHEKTRKFLVSLWKWKRADNDFSRWEIALSDLELENNEKAHCETENKNKKIIRTESESVKRVLSLILGKNFNS